ncbi:T-complex-associated testis-expressed protein 1 [Orussus abietinus]|uniref:T-complex-associated testis-expressed protein 1 n=1 Tax=Orussus abietinus TaxID=222816 RepID=UPI000624F7E0|nr:T-complex-associated testis-expressed protein 1 [Orussus abietinus]
MVIPCSISKNAFEAYRCSVATISLPSEYGRTLRSENEEWAVKIIPDLKVLALKAIVDQWQENPIFEELPTCVDQEMLLEMLPTNLPFEMMIRRISHEYYWQRAAKDKWKHNNPNDHGDSWRRLYCERYLEEYLEALDPNYFKAQQENFEKLIALVRDYVCTLRIRSLVPTKYPFKWSGEEDEDQCTNKTYSVDHIPMGLILPRLPFLQELSINFGMIYMNDGFEWRDFQFSVEDCTSLGRGIKNCSLLKKFSLTRSNLDQPRVAALLQGVVVNNRIEELDLSHCKLGDTGAHAIGEFLTIHKRLKVLKLANNMIGSSGLAGIVYGLLQENSTPIKRLDLRLNPLQDEGGTHFCALLLRHGGLEYINVSGCGLTANTGMGMAEIIASGCMKFYSLEVDLSNNNFGPIAGEAFEVAMKTSSVIIGFDARLCNFTKESEYFISESVTRNKTEKKKERAKAAAARRTTDRGPARTVSLQVPPEYAHLQQPQRRRTVSRSVIDLAIGDFDVIVG